MDVVGKAAFNGMSELMANIATSLVSMVYNKQLMNYAQENGVAAYGVIMYVQFVFLGMLFGYTFGSSPIIFGVNGIWGAVAVAEVASCILSWAFLFTQNKKYHYLISK